MTRKTHNKLNTETPTPAMERRVLREARPRLGMARRLSADFEHGQWWITDLDSGAQWSVVDCLGPAGDYFDFERVTEGDE
jgi:hypothetical protein